MTRLEFETEILTMMGLTTATAATATRTYIQNKAQSALNTIWSDNKFGFRRKPFGIYLAAPITGTINITLGQSTGTVDGSNVPSSSWIGCHLVLSGNGFPLQVQKSGSGQVLTFTTPILAPTNATLAYTLYFDGALYPADCASIDRNTLKVAGRRRLTYVPPDRLDMGQGYNGVDGSDYGRFASGGGVSTVSEPDVGEPTVYTTWGNATVSSKVRRLMSVYPYPNAAMVLSFNGWTKPTIMTADSDVPELPESFHLTLMLPRIKLEMCEYPGFELTDSEKKSLQSMYAENLPKLYYEDYQDSSEDQAYTPGVN